jgi:hypothetical protein
MGLKHFIGFTCLLLLSMSLCSNSTLASTLNDDLDNGLNISLLSQDPDPTKPGDILEIRLAVENTGYNDIENSYLEIKPEYPFKALNGENLVEKIGTLGRRSEDERRTVFKFKLGVENDINKGKYPLKVRFYSTSSDNKISITREIPIDIDSESNAEIEYISVEKLVPGEKTNLIFGIKNVGKSPLKNAMFSWECANDVILPIGSSNMRHINLINIGETANVSFNVLTNVNTKPGLYKLDLLLTYDDIEKLTTITEGGNVENEKRKEIKSKSGIYIGGTTDFDIAFMEKSPTGDYTFSISNIGNNGANSVKVSVPPQANWTVVDGSSNSVLLGNLQKGVNANMDFNLKPLATGEDLPIKFEIRYTSSDGLRQFDEKTLSLYASDSTVSVDSEMPEESNNSSILPSSLLILVLVLVVAGGFFAYKKHQKKMKEKDTAEKEAFEEQMEEKKIGE